jgi:hypothetical protein
MNLNDIAPDQTYRVVEFELSEDRTTMNFGECCDYFFEAKLNKSEVARLIEELKLMHGTMVDAPSGDKCE